MSRPIYSGFLLSLLLSIHARADNGAVALVAAADDPSWHPLPWTSYGRPPASPQDLTAQFSVELSNSRDTLLVAVVVDDESHDLAPSGAFEWDSQDGCEVFIQWPRQAPQQMVIRSAAASSAVGSASRVVDAGRLIYRLRLPAPQTLPQEAVIGFDLAVVDADADGSFTWQTWGRGEQKMTHPGRLGDLILTNRPTAYLSGKIEAPAGDPGGLCVRVSPSHPAKEWEITARSDDAGRFSLQLPAGDYDLQLGDSTTVQQVLPGTTQVEIPAGRSAVTGDKIPIRWREQPMGEGQVNGAWRTYRLPDGLPGPRIHELEAINDEIWVAADQGLARFDGAVIRTMEMDEPTAFQVIYPDQTGRIWLGSGWLSDGGRGVFVLSGDTLTHFGRSHGLPDLRVTDVIEDQQGNVWLATFGGGVVRYDGQRFRTYTVEDGLGDNIALALAVDAEGVVWVATGYGRSGGRIGGLSRFEAGQFTTLTTDDGLESNWVTDLSVGTDESIWFSTLGGGIARYRNGEIHSLALPDESRRVWALSAVEDDRLLAATSTGIASVHVVEFDALPIDGFNHEVFDVVTDAAGRIWVATARGQLLCYDGTHVRTMVPAGETAAITTILQDVQGSVWAIGHGASVVTPEGLRGSAGSITGIQDALAAQDTMWFATHDGLWSVHEGDLSRYGMSSGLSDARTERLARDSSGTLWVGTRSGVARRRGNRFEMLTSADGLPHPHVIGFEIDGEGDLWIGTRDGVCRYREEQAAESLECEWPLPPGPVDPLFIDQSGAPWFHVSGGLAVYKDGDWLTMGVAEGLPTASVVSAFQDHTGRLWVGTTGGPAYLQDARFIAIDLIGGTSIVFSIDEPIAGEIWFGTRDLGVQRYHDGMLQTLFERDGIGGNSVYDIEAGEQDAIWIATDGGLTRYLPSTEPPEVHISDVVTSVPHGTVSTVSMPSSQRHLTIFFQARGLGLPARSPLYRHRLRGHSDSWQYTRMGRADYEDLARGDYFFEVQAVSRDFVLSLPAHIEIRVDWPYERVLWGSGMALLVLLMGVQIRRVMQRDHRLQLTNAALLRLNEDLSEQERKRQHAEEARAQLDTQVRDLRHLERLRGRLSDTDSLDSILAAAGEAVVATIAAPGSRVHLHCDGRHWDSGGRQRGTHYRHDLSWGVSTRGELEIWVPSRLEEGHRRALLDETAMQVTRALETRELTAQLLQQARLVALGQMAAGVAHELNQPLTAIATVAGDIHLRLLDGHRPSDDRLRQMMTDLTGMVDRMSSTIEHLRVFSRDTSAEPGVPVDLNEVVESGLKVLGTQLANNNILVEQVRAPHVPTIHGQPYQLEQVLLNFLTNARDALDDVPEGQSRTIRVTTSWDAGLICLEVADNGPGIAPEDKERLFEPFFTTKPADRGTGLGLSISYAIVRNHGGTITCDSTLGHGTVFRAEFPVEVE